MIHNSLLEGLKDRLINKEMIFHQDNNVAVVTFILSKKYDSFIKPNSTRARFYGYINEEIENLRIDRFNYEYKESEIDKDDIGTDYEFIDAFELKISNENIMNINIMSFLGGVNITCNHKYTKDLDSAQAVMIMDRKDPYHSTSRDNIITAINTVTNVIRRYNTTDDIHRYFKENEPIHTEKRYATTENKFVIEDDKEYRCIIVFPSTNGTPIVRIQNVDDNEYAYLDIYDDRDVVYFNNVSDKRDIDTIVEYHHNSLMNIEPMNPVMKYNYVESILKDETISLTNDGEVYEFIANNIVFDGKHSVLTTNAGNIMELDNTEKYDNNPVYRLTDNLDAIKKDYPELFNPEFIETIIDVKAHKTTAESIIEHIKGFKFTKNSGESLPIKVAIVSIIDHTVIKFYLCDEYIYANIYVNKSTDVDYMERKLLYNKNEGRFILNSTMVNTNEESGRYNHSFSVDLPNMHIQDTRTRDYLSGESEGYYHLTYYDALVHIDCVCNEKDEVVAVLSFISDIYSTESEVYLRDRYGIPYKLKFMQEKEIPKTCADCDDFHGEWGICKITGHGNKFDSEGNRFIDCPLVNENQNTKIK